MKLDLILENVRNKYNMGLLEESNNLSEKDLLQGKILINESTMFVRKMLVEEGTIQAVKDILQVAFFEAVALDNANPIEEFEDMFDNIDNSTVAGGVAAGAAVGGIAAAAGGSQPKPIHAQKDLSRVGSMGTFRKGPSQQSHKSYGR